MNKTKKPEGMIVRDREKNIYDDGSVTFGLVIYCSE